MEFTVGSAIRLGWETFKTRPWFFIGASVVIVLANALATVVSAAVDVRGTFDDPSLLGQAVDFALSSLVDMGMIAFYLAAHADPEAAELSQLWHPRPYLKYLATSFLVYCVVGLGLLLLIVPGIIAIVVFMFAMIIVIDQELGPIDAMSESIRITRGNRWPLLGLAAVQIAIGVAGVLALGVGVLVAIPVVMISLVHAYRVLLSKAGPPPDETGDRSIVREG
jgi:uncharacterized membrane protein